MFLKASKKKHLVLCHNLFILLYCGIVSPPGRLYEGQHHHHERMFDSSHIPAINITLHSPNANRVLGRAEYILKLMRVPINYIRIRIQTENFSYSDIKKTGKKLRNKPRDITIVYTYYTYSSPFVKLFGNYMFPPLLVPGFLILAAPAPMVIGSIADTYRYRYNFDTDPDIGYEKFRYGSGSRPTFDTDPDPGKNIRIRIRILTKKELALGKS